MLTLETANRVVRMAIATPGAFVHRETREIDYYEITEISEVNQDATDYLHESMCDGELVLAPELSGRIKCNETLGTVYRYIPNDGIEEIHVLWLE